MIVGRRILLALFASAICFGPLAAQDSTLPDAAPAVGGRIAAVTARHGMVVAQEGRAAHIGVEILRQGGNAVDAAVATGFALAVTYPRAGNIGGGGYMLVHLAGRNIDTAIDYRETAPAATTPDIFLDERGEADPRKSRDSALGDRRARHGRGACARAREIRLGKIHAGATDRAGDPARARGDSDRGRHRGLAAAFAGRGSRAGLPPRRSSSPTGACSRPARHWCRATSPIRSPRLPATGPRGVLRRADRREDRRHGARRRRPDDARRPQELSGGRARTGARALSRLRRPLDAAVLVRRRDPDRNAQHPRRLPRSCRR